ncbi:unnamed protein product [Sphagnum jensenii]|uniref:Cullin N-terminal domain-containing protein n=1 Tax=Sphagnum jensenii TaxID=128206 RepID=A0ABP1A5Q7_9BRYO
MKRRGRLREVGGKRGSRALGHRFAGTMTMNREREVIELEQGRAVMQKGITKLKNLLEGVPEQQFNSKEYIMFYKTIYKMCTQKPPQDYSQQLYDRYRESFEEYINSTVLPALREKHDEFMLRELVMRWDNHKIMVRWLSRFFNYLDRYFIARKSLPALGEVGLMCFRDLVYAEMKTNVKDAVITLIDREREGEQIDRALLKSVLGIFVEIGMGNMDVYETDFEGFMLQNTAAYYSHKAASWIEEDSCPDYMLKKVQHELLTKYENHLLEKEHSGCDALLRDDKAFVCNVNELHDKCLLYVSECFLNDSLFHEVGELLADIGDQDLFAELWRIDGDTSASSLTSSSNEGVPQHPSLQQLRDESDPSTVVALMGTTTTEDFFTRATTPGMGSGKDSQLESHE